MTQSGVSDLNSDKILAARKIEVEAQLQEWEKQKEKEKKKKMKQELDKMMQERAVLRPDGSSPLTEETIKQFKLDKSELNKLLLQEKSPGKYQNEGHGILRALTENMYRQQQQNKVKQLEERVAKFVKDHKSVLPSDVSPVRMRGKPADNDLANMTPGLHRAESKGLFDLFENNDKRQQGAKLI